jgi:hypothetical protein
MRKKTRDDLPNDALGKTKDELLALCLARGQTRREAAKSAKVSIRTVYNRLLRPEFRELVRSHQKQLIDAAYGEMADGLRPMVRKLRELAENPDAKVQIAAAKAFGALFIRLGFFHAHEDRIRALEEGARNKGGSS